MYFLLAVSSSFVTVIFKASVNFKYLLLGVFSSVIVYTSGVLMSLISTPFAILIFPFLSVMLPTSLPVYVNVAPDKLFLKSLSYFCRLILYVPLFILFGIVNVITLFESILASISTDVLSSNFIPVSLTLVVPDTLVVSSPFLYKSMPVTLILLSTISFFIFKVIWSCNLIYVLSTFTSFTVIISVPVAPSSSVDNVIGSFVILAFPFIILTSALVIPLAFVEAVCTLSYCIFLTIPTKPNVTPEIGNLVS